MICARLPRSHILTDGQGSIDLAKMLYEINSATSHDFLHSAGMIEYAYKLVYSNLLKSIKKPAIRFVPFIRLVFVANVTDKI